MNFQQGLSGEDEECWKALSTTEQEIATLWADSIPGLTKQAIRVDNSFFDLGGHSILAQEVLLEVNRKLRGVSFQQYANGTSDSPDTPARGFKKEYVPMASLFRNPTLKGFAQEVDAGRAKAITGEDHDLPHALLDAYSKDAKNLTANLEPAYPSAPFLEKSSSVTIFLTGATGFLGAYLLREILERGPHFRVVAHLRAKSADAGMQRLRDTCDAYGIWNSEWEARLKCVPGDLGSPQLGMTPEAYLEVVQSTDVVIHNGAAVHWVQPYDQLKRVNVLGTIEALRLCSHSTSGTPKRFVFVSSTSVLDSVNYAVKSERSLRAGGTGIMEADSLMDSEKGLGTGYGQSKWVGEYLVREAGRRGLVGAIVRPGYILGDSWSGGEPPLPSLVANADGAGSDQYGRFLNTHAQRLRTAGVSTKDPKHNQHGTR